MPTQPPKKPSRGRSGTSDAPERTANDYTEQEILAALLNNERSSEFSRRTGVPIPKITAVKRKYGLEDPKKEKIVARVSFLELNKLQSEALRRKVLTDRLVTLLITQIVKDDLFAAVLDDLDELP